MLDLSHTLIRSEAVWISTVIPKQGHLVKCLPSPQSLTEVPPDIADGACGMLKLHL